MSANIKTENDGYRKGISYEYMRDSKQVFNCWEVVNNKFWPHFHSSLELIYVTDGELKVTLNGQLYSVLKGNVLIIPSYFIHSYDTEEYSKAYIAIIPLDSIPSYKSLLSRNTFVKPLISNSADKKELLHLFKSLSLYNIDNGDAVTASIRKGYSYALMGLLIKESGLTEVPNNKTISLAQEILMHLQNNYLSSINLKDIALHFGYSKSRFSHIFNEYYDCTLVDYINGLRSRHALKLLWESELNVTEIGLSCGFESTRTFYRAFSRTFGCTPGEYRKSCNNINQICNDFVTQT